MHAIWVVQCFGDRLALHDVNFIQHILGNNEVFMDDFSVVGDSFDRNLDNMAEVFKSCEAFNLGLNWEKCNFMCLGTKLGEV